MSEKRFVIDDDGIYDNQEKKHFKFVAYDWIECDIYECCEKLNEQQDQISYWKREYIYLLRIRENQQQMIIKLKEGNEELISTKCTNCELINLQTRKIDSLEKENEQLKKQNIEYEEVQCKILNYIIDKGLGSEFAKFLRENM